MTHPLHEIGSDISPRAAEVEPPAIPVFHAGGSAQSICVSSSIGRQAPVLDACCGSRMFWFDKADDRAVFLDKRRETAIDRDGREVVVNPDVLGSYASLPFEDETFSLVVFDPPHTYNGTGSEMAKKFGRLEPGWREEITAGFAECFRVLKPSGTLIFKWNEHRVSLKKVLAMTPEKPLFGHRSGAAAKTHWVAFMKAATDCVALTKNASGGSRE